MTDTAEPHVPGNSSWFSGMSGKMTEHDTMRLVTYFAVIGVKPRWRVEVRIKPSWVGRLLIIVAVAAFAAFRQTNADFIIHPRI